MSTPLQSYLSSKLSGIDVTESTRPVCRLCECQGRADETLLIGGGEAVYACAWWKAVTGWDLFGIYHADHSVSDIVERDPPRPTAVLRGVIEQTDYETTPQRITETYTLTDVSLDSVRYPVSLGR
jgi:hypothetical protein